ncbi:MAG: alpha/beta hydrolase-fold protein [Rhodanobacteraceae bacterium]
MTCHSFVAVVIAGFGLFASTLAAAHPFVLPNTEVTTLTSRRNGHEYVLYISLPRDYATHPERRYPVIYTLDADYAFPLVTTICGHFADRGDVPALIVVGIAYPGGIADIDSYHRNRTRDYTPTHTLKGGYGRKIQTLSGGGPAFLKFITGELLPYVESHYRADPKNRTLVGHSYGGLFGTYVLLTQPKAFRNYVLVSPSLWYDDKVALRMEAAYARVHDDLPARVYFVVGSYENQPQHGRAMVDDMRELLNRLQRRGYPHFDGVGRVLDRETHNSIFPAGVTRGLRVVLGN